MVENLTQCRKCQKGQNFVIRQKSLGLTFGGQQMSLHSYANASGSGIMNESVIEKPFTRALLLSPVSLTQMN